jgi:hypothetical protein
VRKFSTTEREEPKEPLKAKIAAKRTFLVNLTMFSFVF